MIPRNGPKSEVLPSLKLYKEDIEKLVALFTKNCQHVRIGDEEHVYDSLEDMAAHVPPRLSSLIISGMIPHAELIVRGSHNVPLGVQRSTLWIADRNEKSEMLFLSAKEILGKRIWRAGQVGRLAMLWTSGFLVLVSIFAKSLVRAHIT